MSTMNKSENVKEQYNDDKNLSIRTKLHLKYGTNKQGFFPWLFEKYEFPERGNILLSQEGSFIQLQMEMGE